MKKMSKRVEVRLYPTGESETFHADSWSIEDNETLNLWKKDKDNYLQVASFPWHNIVCVKMVDK